MKICPICGKEYVEPPAISRKDNKTEICSDCGILEALDAVGFDDDKKKWVLETIHRDVKTLMQKNSNETENNPPASGSPVIGYLDSETVERIKKEYPPGTRVELVKMNDPYTKLKPGDRGTVSSVDDIGTVHVDWDCGSGLGVAYGVDRIIKLPPEEET